MEKTEVYDNITDRSFIAYKVVKYHNPQGSLETGLWCTISKYSLDRATERGDIDGSGFILTEKGEYLLFPILDKVSVVADCTEKQIDSINNALADCNLSVKTTIKRTLTPLGAKGIYGVKTIAFHIKDADKVLYQLKGKYLTKDELMATRIEDGMALGLYHDNGFSYIGFTPLDTKKYLSAVNYALHSPINSHFFDCNGILIRWDATNHRYFVKCMVSVNKEYSEVSNT